jgi:hypothetical protein
VKKKHLSSLLGLHCKALLLACFPGGVDQIRVLMLMLYRLMREPEEESRFLTCSERFCDLFVKLDVGEKK